jgi:hypothetical protein
MPLRLGVGRGVNCGIALSLIPDGLAYAAVSVKVQIEIAYSGTCGVESFEVESRSCFIQRLRTLCLGHAGLVCVHGREL